MTLDSPGLTSPIRVPFGVQLVAWIAGILACLAGAMDMVAEWSLDHATAQFLLMALAPIAWMIKSHRIANDGNSSSSNSQIAKAWVASVFVMMTTWLTCAFVGWSMVDFPPAYHDEYSYLFQAKTVLMGVFSVPSHPVVPELFNQMHVLNEGRMASRYYPGTGLWLAPFVAMKHPYWGYWLATSLASFFVFWTGYELGRLRVAIVSGLTFALSPGIAIFGNLLLAHQPTMLGLTVFLWAFTRWMRTLSSHHAFVSGCGLSFAMISRPATAAGFGLPFGIAFFYCLLSTKRQNDQAAGPHRFRTLIAMGAPLVIGWAIMLAYNQSVTGSWQKSPYQLYTDIYTPRHVYGFNNVERGEKRLGPKVIESYDRWAKNLTPELAASNLLDRLFSSWLWTFDLLPFLLSSIIVAGTLRRTDRRWRLICCSILSLHAVHIPYWYSGILGWHYVFETAPLWCLLLGLTTDILFRVWRASGRWVMPIWWTCLLLSSFAEDYAPLRFMNEKVPKASRVARGINSIRYPRYLYAEFDHWLNASVTVRPAIVLIDADPNDTHMDYVTNSPGLNEPILRARLIQGSTNLSKVFEAFPDRSVYLCQPQRKLIQRIRASTESP